MAVRTYRRCKPSNRSLSNVNANININLQININNDREESLKKWKNV